MPRGTLLSTVRSMLKAEVGDFSGTNSARDAELNQLLFNKQQQLLMEKEWPFLVRRWNVGVGIATRFVSFPTIDADLGENALINLDEIRKVEVRWNNQWYPLQYGIGEDEYNTLDPTLNQAADPIRRWREASNVFEPGLVNQTTGLFEVWPLPVSAQTVRFTAERLLQQFQADTDRLDLDDQLVVLGVAADVLLRNKQPDAQIKAQLFARRLHQLGSGNPTVDRCRILGEGRYDRPWNVKLVAIAGSGGSGGGGGGGGPTPPSSGTFTADRTDIQADTTKADATGKIAPS